MHSFLGLILPGAVDSQTLQIPLAPPGCWIRVVSPSGQDFDANIAILKRKAMDFGKELEQRVKEAMEAVPKFLQGSYAGTYQEELTALFHDNLKGKA